MTAQTNETTDTNQQDIAEDSALSLECAAEHTEVLDKAQRTKAAARELSRFTSTRKNELLLAAVNALVASTEEILVANAKDIETGEARGFSDSLLDRLRPDAAHVEGIAGGLHQVMALSDPVGEVPRGSTPPNGIKLFQVSVPLGAMGMVYKARSNVTADALGLASRSGNVALLRGSKFAVHSNTQLVTVLREALVNHSAPEDPVQLLPCETHDSVQSLIIAHGLIDVVTPRDDAGLIEAAVTKVTVSTIETGTGNCHICTDAPADIDEATALMINGKIRRPSACNATEIVLVDSALSAQNQVRTLGALANTGVAVHGDVDNLTASGWTGEIILATVEDWSNEYLSSDATVRIVDGVVAATDHITKYSSGHTEAIPACNWGVYQEFVDQADAITVSVNAPTAFIGGERYGSSAETGISTQRLHVCGLTGLSESTSNKWVLAGCGQTRPQCPGRAPYMTKRKGSARLRVHAALTSKLAEAPQQHISVMGGTFDSIHNSHLVTISEVANRSDLDFVLFVLTGKPWRKYGQRASRGEDRYLVAIIATALDPQLSALRTDIDRPGATYTVDTLRDSKVIYPNANLFFITSADALQKIMTWRDWEEVSDAVTFVGVARPGAHLRAEDLEGIDASRLHLIEIPVMATPPTDYRKHAEAGRPVWYLVPDEAMQYIAKRGLYQFSEGAVDFVGPVSVSSTSENAASVGAALMDAKFGIAGRELVRSH